MKNLFLTLNLLLLCLMVPFIGKAQSVTIKPDNYKQEFIGVGASVGNYFDKYFDNSTSDRQQICRWLAQDLNYKYLKSYDGDNHPDDRPDYYDDRATFFHDLQAYAPGMEMIICVNQVSKMYQSSIDVDEPGIYDVVAQRYFDILEAYKVRNVPVTILELVNEPGGESKVLTIGKVYAYAVPKLKAIINNSSLNPHGVPMPKIAGPATWGVDQCPYWINGFKNNLPSAWNNLDIVTTHGYNNGWKTNLYSNITDIIEGKPFYHSEQTGKCHSGDGLYEQEQSGTIDPYISAGLSICQIYTAGMNGGISAFLAFQNYNTKDNDAALLQVTSGNSPLTKKMYWAFKQITSIQPANCYRVGKNESGLSNVRILTMRKPGDNSVYLHLTNISPNATNVTVDVSGYSIKGYTRWVTDQYNNSATATETKNYSTAKSNITVNIAGHAVTTFKLEIEAGNSNSSYEAFYITHKASGLKLQSSGSDAVLVSSGNTGDNVKWILKEAETGYYYIENAADGTRLYSADGSNVSVTSGSTTSDNARWSRSGAGGSYEFILNKQSGTKLHSKSSTGWDVMLVSSGWTGDNVQWTFTSAGTVMKSATLTPNDASLNVAGPELYCYPNPTQDILRVGGTDEVTSIAIYNLSSVKVLENQHSNFINVEKLPAGMYLVSINKSKAIPFVKK